MGRDPNESAERIEGGWAMSVDRMDSLERARRLLTGLCARGLEHFVLSPGSRNAPLIGAAAQLESEGLLTMHRLLDERSAAHFALGLAMAAGRPAAVCCTSGTAVANLGPAIIEAATSKVPLIALTADRPAHLHNVGESQTIAQASLHAEHARLFSWEAGREDALDDIWAAAIQGGAVHVNVPLDSPLYPAKQGISESLSAGDKTNPAVRPEPKGRVPEALLKAREKGERVMWICGGGHQQVEVGGLAQLEVVLADLNSGVRGAGVIHAVDRAMQSSEVKEHWPRFEPELVLVLGAPYLSRVLRERIRDCGVKTVQITVADLLESLPTEASSSREKAWWTAWHDVNFQQLEVQQGRRKEWSDFSVYQQIAEVAEGNWDLHWGNSTAVRYAQLLAEKWRKGVRHFGNRGAAGIEGSTSTAMGQAAAEKAASKGRSVVLVCGDLSFMYDAGAWTVRPLPHNFKAVVINNGGGGIFSWLEGAQRMPTFERDIAARHNESVLPIAKMHGVKTLQATDEEGLRRALDELACTNEAVVLEVITPGAEDGFCGIFAPEGTITLA